MVERRDYLNGAHCDDTEKKNIAIYGSTGSIGTQALDVSRGLDDIHVSALVCNSNIELMARQIDEFRPEYAAVVDEKLAAKLESIIRSRSIDTKILAGEQGAIEACSHDSIDTVISAPVGIAGLYPTLELIKTGKNMAIANKETLVTGGEIVTSLAKRHNASIIPIDSEHSAIFQCLQGNDDNPIEKIILTCSGGPFRGKKREELRGVTVEQALKHPNWSMGGKITIDSATLMNKGLEVIEARWLFGMTHDRIEVVVHPQSLMHSAVQYEDGSIMAQLGAPDMRIPIQYSLTYPKRVANSFKRIDLISKRLDFESPDYETFKCLAAAKKALDKGGHYPTVVNGANEAAVNLFLSKRISFLDIMDLVEGAMLNYKESGAITLESIFEADRWAREYVNENTTRQTYK